MSEINLKLKSYDELLFEITTLNTNKYLLEQKLNKQKEILDKIKEILKKDRVYIAGERNLSHEIEELLEEIE